jgi:hypothetical protein
MYYNGCLLDVDPPTALYVRCFANPWQWENLSIPMKLFINAR